MYLSQRTDWTSVVLGGRQQLVDLVLVYPDKRVEFAHKT